MIAKKDKSFDVYGFKARVGEEDEEEEEHGEDAPYLKRGLFCEEILVSVKCKAVQ